MLVWFAILIALVPSFALFVYVARTRKSMWLAFAIGAIGWTVALYARLPILNVIQTIISSSIIVFAIASLFAGIFEEGIRYVLVRKIKYLRFDWRHVLSFGLGWGFFEAVLMYAVNMLATIYVLGYEIPFLDMLPGAVERNFAVMLHVGLTFIVYKAVISRKIAWVPVAIALHAIVDFIFVSLYYTPEFPVWYAEVAVLVMSSLTLIFAYIIVKKDVKSHLEDAALQDRLTSSNLTDVYM
jgi:uncharacterized membrane protein YhfC